MHAITIPVWLAFPDVEKPYVEEICGHRERKVSPKRRHALLQTRVAAALDRWATGRGEVGTEWRCYLIAAQGRPSSLVPDVAYYSFARLPAELDEDRRERPRIAPDIVVEILSPGDRRRTLDEKIGLYLRHGSIIVLVLDPDERTLVTHRREASSGRRASGRITIDPYDDLVLDCDELFRGV
jgi:Uma2 family endonuclease